jgi:hypothetical protein
MVAASAGGPAGSAEPARRDPALRLAVNEAATAAIPIAALIERYDPLAHVLGRAAGAAVECRPFISVDVFEAELATRPSFVFCKTVDLLAREIAALRYLPLVKIDRPYLAGIIVGEHAKARSLADLAGTDLLLPPPGTLTAKLAKAALRDAGLETVVVEQSAPWPTRIRHKVTLRHVQFQEAIPDAVGRGYWFHAGAVNPTVLKRWKGRVLTHFAPQPNWSVGAHADTPARSAQAAIAALESMHETTGGRAALAAMNIDRFVPASRADYLRLAAYLTDVSPARGES